MSDLEQQKKHLFTKIVYINSAQQFVVSSLSQKGMDMGVKRRKTGRKPGSKPIKPSRRSSSRRILRAANGCGGCSRKTARNK